MAIMPSFNIRRSRLVAVAVVCLTAVAPLVSTTAEASAEPVLTNGAYFNDANDPAARSVIEDKLVELINGTPSGESVRMNFSSFSSANVTNALLTAKTRGASVQIVADGAIANSGYFGQLVAALGTDTTKPSFVKSCVEVGDGTGHGCVRNPFYPETGAQPYAGIHHTKFVLFSKTLGADRVVFETSQNMQDGVASPNSGYRGFNNAVVLTDQDAVYAGYGARFSSTVSRSVTDYSSTNDTDTKAYFEPLWRPHAEYRSPANSPLMGVLGNIDCGATNTSGGWGPNHYTSIHVVNFEWNDWNIAHELLKLDNEGCVVHIVRTKNFHTETRTDAAHASAEATDRYFLDVDDMLDSCGTRNGMTQDFIDSQASHYTGAKAMLSYIHSKYLIVDGNYTGQANQQRVWTGSYNLTYAALRTNDETLLNLRDKAMFDAYQANFYKLATLPTTLDGLSYRTTKQGGTC